MITFSLDVYKRQLLFLVFQQLQVFGDQLASLFYAVRGSVRILRKAMLKATRERVAAEITLEASKAEVIAAQNANLQAQTYNEDVYKRQAMISCNVQPIIGAERKDGNVKNENNPKVSDTSVVSV